MRFISRVLIILFILSILFTPVLAASIFSEGFLDVLVVDERDGADERDFPVRAVKYDTMMTLVEKSEALAGFVMGLFSDIR